MYKQVKVAAISLKPTKWDKPGNADAMERFFREAAAQGPDIVLTTEGVLEGYVVMDVVEGRKSAADMLEIAEPIDGPYIRRFQDLAKELDTCIAFGFAERVGQDVFNAAVFIDDEGEIRGRYHKTQLAEGTDESCSFNRVGSQLRAFDTPFGRAGFVVCNDRWNPMIVRTLVLDGAQFILIPSFGSKSRGQNETVLARARENGVPIVEANVGMNLIVNKGEAVQYAWGNDRISTAVIDVPVPPSTTAARSLESEYLRLQGPEMNRRFQETRKRLAGRENEVERAMRGELIVS